MRHRPFAVLGVVLLLVVGLLGTPVLGQPGDVVALQRVAAGDRIGTAVAVSQRFFPTADHVVLARADGFADALAGSPLAGLRGAPVLLTTPSALPTAVGEEITRLGATAATILGGEAAVGEAVADQLRAAGLTVERVSGPDRFATAAAVATAAGTTPGGRVVVALGTHPDADRAWPDALSAANLAVDGTPVLLTAPDLLPAATRSAIADLAPSEIVIVGGELAVGPTVEAELTATGAGVTRVAGDSRYTTALAAADVALDTTGTRGATDVPRTVVFTTAEAYPDALASGALLPYLPAVLVLVPTETLDESVRRWLVGRAGQFDEAYVIGGTAAVSETTFDAIQAALGADPDPDPTTAPAPTPSPTDGGQPTLPVSPGGPVPVPTPTDSGSPTPTETQAPDPDPTPTDTETPDPDPTPTETETPDPDTGPTRFTDLLDALAPLYVGDDAVQVGLDPSLLDPARTAGLRGRVLDRDGQPLPGARVDLLGHAELGHTTSQPDGTWTMAVAGGQVLTATVTLEGHVPVQRTTTVPWGDIATLPDVVLMPYDDRSTTIALPVDGPTGHVGSTQTDEDGTRAAGLLFRDGTTATMTLPGGSTEPLSSMTVRATELTVGSVGPLAMPGELPPGSLYTYAVELSVDEAVAAGAVRVDFSQHVALHVDNFLGFPVGSEVPVGVYDSDTASWLPTPEPGIVLAVVGDDGGVARLDIDGDGDADADDDALASSLGIDEDERVHLAGRASVLPSSFSRVRITHFTPYDLNYPQDEDDEDDEEEEPEDDEDEEDEDPCDEAASSMIVCASRSLVEWIDPPGTFPFFRDSQDAVGHVRSRSLTIPLTGPTVSPGTDAVEVVVQVAGQRHVHVAEAPGPEQSWEFVWDGRDLFGRQVVGSVPVTVTHSTMTSSTYATGAFGAPPTTASTSTGVDTREPTSRTRTWTSTLDGLPRPLDDTVGGWSPWMHHRYDPVARRLRHGDGTSRTTDAVDAWAHLWRVTGGGTDPFGSPAVTTAPEASRIAIAADGSIIVAEASQHRVSRITPDGVWQAFAGTGDPGNDGDGGPALAATLDSPAAVAVLPDGGVVVADAGQHRLRLVEPDGTIRAFAGTGEAGMAGDGGPAVDALLDGPVALAVRPDSTVLVADGNNGLLRSIDAEGRITTLAGGGAITDCAAGCLRDEVDLTDIADVAVSPDGDRVAVAATGSRVLELGEDGRLHDVGLRGATVVYGPQRGLWVGSGSGFARWDLGLQSATDFTIPEELFGSDIGPVGARATDHLVAVADMARTPDGQLLLVDATPPDSGAAPTEGIFVLGSALPPRHTVPTSRPGLHAAGPLAEDATYVVPAEEGTLALVFDADGRHLRTVDADRGVVVWAFGYDAGGALVSVTGQTGQTTTIERDADGSPTAIVGHFGHRTDLTVDADGLLSSVTDPLGRTRTFDYDDGLLVAHTDWAGNPASYAYDDLGLLTEAVATDGVSFTLQEEVITETQVDGRRVTLDIGGVERRTYEWVVERDLDLRTTTATLPSGAVNRTYDYRHGEVVAEMADGTSQRHHASPDPRFGSAGAHVGLLERYGGDSLFATTTVEVVMGNPLDPFSVEHVTRTMGISGEGDYVTGLDRDAGTTTRTTPDGSTVVASWDAEGLVTHVDPGDGLAQITIERDEDGLITRTVEGDRVTTTTYGADGLRDSETGPAGRTRTFDHDAAARLVSSSDHTGAAVTYRWDDLDRLLGWTSPEGIEHDRVLTPMGQLTTLDGPPNPLAGLSHDDARQLTSVVHGDGTTTSVTVTGGLRTSSVGPDRTVSWSWLDGEEPGTSDLTGRLSSSTWTAGSHSTTLEVDHRDDRPLEFTWTTDDVDDSVLWLWDDYRPTQRQVNNRANSQIAFDHDDEGRLVESGPWSITRGNAWAAPSAISNGSLETQIVLDEHGVMVARSISHDGNPVATLDLVRGPAGHVTEQVVTADGATLLDAAYGYDDRAWLASATVDGATTTYAYDDDGNRISTTTAAGTTTTVIDDDGIATTHDGAPITVDGNGQVTGLRGMVLDHAVSSELLSVELPAGDTVTYTTDGLGRRASRRDGDGLVRYLYGDPSRPGLVTDVVDPDETLTQLLYDDAGLLYAVRVVENGLFAPSDWYAVLTDTVGSPLVAVDEAGAVVATWTWSPWGELVDRTGTLELPIGFAGGLADDDTGLVRFGVRDYDPVTARWLAPDPAWVLGGSSNLYRYVDNSPVSMHDRTGLFGGCGGLFAGAGAGGCVKANNEAVEVCVEVGAGLGWGGGLTLEGPSGNGNTRTSQARGELGPLTIEVPLDKGDDQFRPDLGICDPDDPFQTVPALDWLKDLLKANPKSGAGGRVTHERCVTYYY